MAGLNHLDYDMDGISLLPYLQSQDLSMNYRDFLIEYHGEGGVHYGQFNKCKESVNDDLENLGQYFKSIQNLIDIQFVISGYVIIRATQSCFKVSRYNEGYSFWSI